MVFGAGDLTFGDGSQLAILHVEAYPRFNVREARKRVLAGQTIISWRDGDGAIVGVGRADIIDDNRIKLDYQFRKHRHINAYRSVLTLECSIRSLEHGQEDFLTSCLKCGTRVRMLLLFEYNWTCVHCQPLAYRSKMIGDLVRKSERLADLEHLIALGRPKGMHDRTFLKLRKERYLLNLELGDHRGKARGVFDEVITCGWSRKGTATFNMYHELSAAICPETSNVGPEDEEAEYKGALLTLAGDPLFAGPSLLEALDAQVLRGAAKELSAMSAQAIVPTAMRLRKRLAVGSFGPPAELRRDDHIRIVRGAGPDVLEAQHRIGFSGNGQYFLVAPHMPVRRHPVATITDDSLLLKGRFTRDEAEFVPVMIEEEYELIERLLDAQRLAVEDYNRRMKVHVRRVVHAHWDTLVEGHQDDAEEAVNTADST